MHHNNYFYYVFVSATHTPLATDMTTSGVDFTGQEKQFRRESLQREVYEDSILLVLSDNHVHTEQPLNTGIGKNWCGHGHTARTSGAGPDLSSGHTSFSSETFYSWDALEQYPC